MKYLILCEGSNEELLINMLLDANKLKIKRDDLIELKPFNARQINPTIVSYLKTYNKPVVILRVGDTQKDILKIPNELKDIVKKENIYKYCTLPELEILLIINEGMYNEYTKTKESPKVFAKRNIAYNKVRYNQSNEFLEQYYGGKRLKLFIDNLKRYKKIKKHNKEELYLIDLIK